MSYDPFAPGPFAVRERTVQAHDAARGRTFPCEIWHPAAAERYPLILFSHGSGGGRRAASYLCSHLASHGYVVVAMDHSEVVAPELTRKEDETPEQREARAQAWIAGRVPDICFLLDFLLSGALTDLAIDSGPIGIIGHSFGGWTALAVPEVDSRIGAIVALAPGGNSQPRPGILKLNLTFDWGRDVPTLYLAADQDVAIPLSGIQELLQRTRGTKRLAILHRADHLHFLDNAEELHENVRKMSWPVDLEWMTKEMKPISELCSGEDAHSFTRSLALAHMDAYLKAREEARELLRGDIAAELEKRGIATPAG